MIAVAVLLHSPMLGPLSWQPTADVLSAAGPPVVVPDLRSGLTQAPYLHSYVSAAANAVDQISTGTAVLIGHSASGPLLPAVALTAATPISGVIYVDAALPYPGESWFDTAPSQLGAHLRELARDGRLPAWNKWFPGGAVDELIADLDLRRRFVDELPHVPPAYFYETLPTSQWQGPSGYLQLSAVYSAHAGRAEAAGWPVQRLELDHLATLTAPDQVAGGLLHLLAALANH